MCDIIYYLTDLPRLRYDGEQVFDKIISKEISVEYIESSSNFDFIKQRINYLSMLEQIFDSNEMIFKYNKNLNAFSVIQADFLIKNNVSGLNIFTFLSESEKSGNYFCRSFFPQEKQDYTFGQTSWTLLYKKKKIISKNEETVLFKHKNYATELVSKKLSSL